MSDTVERYDHFVGGESVASTGDERIDVVYPFDDGVSGVRSDDSRCNVVSVCPDCGRQLGCAYARE